MYLTEKGLNILKIIIININTKRIHKLIREDADLNLANYLLVVGVCY